MEDYWTHVRSPGFDFRKDGVPDHGDATKEDGDPEKYSTKLFRLRAIDLIEDHAANHSTSPFFMYVPFQAVHAPLQAPAFWLDQYNLSQFNQSTDRRTYAAMGKIF
jgi:arylsulfatase A-like enzyme